MGEGYPGLRSAPPGLSHFASSGLISRIDLSRFPVPVIFANAERHIHTYKPETQAKEEWVNLKRGVEKPLWVRVNSAGPRLTLHPNFKFIKIPFGDAL